jgi:hypothetical protein
MLTKSFVSFIAAFAVATGVAVSATPVARNGDCSTGSESCCDSIAYANDPIVALLQGLADIAIPTDVSIPLGISCVGIVSASQW